MTSAPAIIFRFKVIESGGNSLSCNKFRRVVAAYAKSRNLELRGKASARTFVIDEEHLIHVDIVDGTIICEDEKILAELNIMMSDQFYEGSKYHIRKIMSDAWEKMKAFKLMDGIWIVHKDSVKILDGMLEGMTDFIKSDRLEIIITDAPWNRSEKPVQQKIEESIPKEVPEVKNPSNGKIAIAPTPFKPSLVGEPPKHSKVMTINMVHDHAWECGMCAKMNPAKTDACKHCGEKKGAKKKRK